MRVIFIYEILLTDVENIKIIDRVEERKSIENLIDAFNPFSIFISGRSGTGKTLLTRNILTNRFGDFVYINFGQLKIVSTSVMYQNMISHVMNKHIPKGYYSKFLKKNIESSFDIPKKGMSDNDYHMVLLEIIENANLKNIVILLDEIDKLVQKQGDQVLYGLFDIRGFKIAGISTIAISNDMNLFSKLKDDIKQRVAPFFVNFVPYGQSDIYEMVGYYLKLIGEIGCNEIDIVQTARNISNFTKSARTVKLYLYYILNKYKRLIPDAVFEPEIQNKVNTETIMNEIKTMSIYERLILQAVVTRHKQIKNIPNQSNPTPTLESIYEIYTDLFKKEQKFSEPLDDKNLKQHTFYKYLQQSVKRGLLINNRVGFGRGKGIKSMIYPNMDYIELRELVRNMLLYNEDLEDL